LTAATVVSFSMVFAWAGWVAVESLREQRNTSQLKELSQQLLQRAELAIDYAVITLGDYTAPSSDLCNLAALRSLRQQAFARGAVKDISVLGPDGQLRCSTAPIQFDDRPAVSDLPEEYTSRNASIILLPSYSEGSGLFQVIWRIGDTHSIAATLNVDMLMFDIFPGPIRDESLAEILIGPDSVVARFGADSSTGPRDMAQTFGAASERYPVAVNLVVGGRSFENWNPGPLGVVLAVGALFGGLIGFLGSQALLRPASPVDALRIAIRRGELVPFYQPIFELKSRRIVGCEVLVRWQKKDGEMVFPDRFIPIAEASGLIVSMTEHLVAQALSEIADLLDSRPRFRIAFNIDPAHFVAPGFLETLDRIVAVNGGRNDRVVLELTERTSFPDMAQAAAVAGDARRRGYRISLDDTGAGHNGLGHIQDLSPDVIKIDKKFVDMIEIELSAGAIVELLVNLGQRLGATLVAEGIEHDAQRLILVKAGVAQGQGYLVSKPVPGPAFRALLADDV